jgi:hypothetical protein
MRFASFGKDHISAALCVALGIAVLGIGLRYDIGSLQQMGAGFVPVVIGALLILVGIAIGATATPRAQEVPLVALHRRTAESRPEWRGWTCIVAGVVAFVVLGRWGGLAPASFFSVFIAALGDRENTLRSSAVLATIVTLFGIVVFYWFLSLQLPLFQWG